GNRRNKVEDAAHRMFPLLRITISPWAEVFDRECGASQNHVGGDKNERAHHPLLPARTEEAPDSGDDEVKQRHRQDKFPCEVHQLVLAQAGEGSAQPDEYGDRKHYLREKPDPRRNEAEEGKRCGPTAKEERDAE